MCLSLTGTQWAELRFSPTNTTFSHIIQSIAPSASLVGGFVGRHIIKQGLYDAARSNEHCSHYQQVVVARSKRCSSGQSRRFSWQWSTIRLPTRRLSLPVLAVFCHIQKKTFYISNILYAACHILASWV